MVGLGNQSGAFAFDLTGTVIWKVGGIALKCFFFSFFLLLFFFFFFVVKPNRLVGKVPIDYKSSKSDNTLRGDMLQCLFPVVITNT